MAEGPHLDTEEVGRLLESAYDTNTAGKLTIAILAQISGQLDRLSNRNDEQTKTLGIISERLVKLETLNFADVAARLRKLEDEGQRRDGMTGLANWCFKNAPMIATWLIGAAVLLRMTGHL